MPNGQVDPARLEGEELRRWYLRTPQQVEAEREAAAAHRQSEFYGRSEAQSLSAGTAPRAPAASRPPGPSLVRYGNLTVAQPDDMSELRRQQAAFERGRREISRENSWMLAPALAPAAAVVGLEAAAAIAATLAPKLIARGPLVLTRRDPYRRVGDNHAARVGRRADKYYKEMARSKDGWDAEPRLELEGKLLKPDIGAPARSSDSTVRRYIEIKPNTPSGRAAAARQIKKYKAARDQNVRALFYDPKKF